MTLPLNWIFGYGSLLWRPAFEHEEEMPGYIRGWRRRFWQGSTDHRGVPGKPGRVVTLVPDTDAECFGMAYRISAQAKDDIYAGLDHREKGGYERHQVEVWAQHGRSVQAVTYIATRVNENYLGPAPMLEIAEQVRQSSGPSGANLEYVLRLAQWMRSNGGDDADVFELESLLRERTDDG